MIRSLDLTDAQAIKEINKESLAYDFPVKDTLNQLKTIIHLPNNHIFVYETKNKHVVGYIHMAEYENTYHKSLKNIITLAVKAQYQNQGIATQLLNKAEEWSKKNGSAGIRLVTGFERKSARIFYEKHGYKKRKDQTNYIKWWS
ncbi:GNAT family N-acetyltransferase [Ligilactobacillus acidipiscis]|uniref:GNAT family N-acetyltransferase n=1 Tax=Ligilactobacillus acidipiscis TaxID=89059 RepID=UPI0023F8F48E|nr:GNAT family N-acetyltransferase [Ligilactobacillus acidipiscis]WEV58163.1 GNAT family N-acetyltransferase [Ligilactobacillus acidipiscis]